MTEKVQEGRELGIKKFDDAIQECNCEEEISGLCQMLAILSVKLLRGIEGEEFKKDFLKAAMSDKGKITLHKSVEH